MTSPSVGIGSTDTLAPYRSAVSTIRLACIAFVAAMAGPAVSNEHWRLAAVSVGLVVFHAVRILTPIRDRGRTVDLVPFGVELGVHIAAVLATGGWESPLLLPLLGVVAITGFARGLRVVIPVAAVAAALLAIPNALHWWGLSASLVTSRQWALEIVLVGGVAGYARRITGAAKTDRTEALLWVQQLSDANELLSSLHRVAQELPAQLDLDGVLDGTLGELRNHLEFDGAAILITEGAGTSDHWRLARRDGVEATDQLEFAELPVGVARTVQRGTIVRLDLGRPGTPLPGGFRPTARVGVYAPLVARGAVVGALALEFDQTDHASVDRAVEVARGLSEPAGLGIDNARWFARLRLVGADEERTRIAHDLHDGVGQTLAYLGFELERLKRSAGESPIAEDLGRLRGDLRTALAEIRETLFDLRSDVTAEVDVAAAFERCCARVEERSGLKVRFESRGDGRLPLRQEHELWRIGQEAIVAAERQWGATTIDVRWWRDGRAAEIEITHDGPGARAGRRRSDALELATLRDRADSLGAEFSVRDTGNGHTTLRCRLEAA